MLAMLAVLGVNTSDLLQEQRPPPPPVMEHPFPPEVRIVATSYFCNGRESRYTIRYERHTFQEIVSATRDDIWVHPESLRTINEMLRRLPGVGLSAECWTAQDSIEVTFQPQISNAMIRSVPPRVTAGWIHWSGERMEFVADAPARPSR